MAPSCPCPLSPAAGAVREGLCRFAQATLAMLSMLELLLEEPDPGGWVHNADPGKGKCFDHLNSLISGLDCYFWSCCH